MSSLRTSGLAALWRGEFILSEERSANEFVITRDTFWQALLGEDKRNRPSLVKFTRWCS